jgi:PAS domain S-box-containing protein
MLAGGHYACPATCFGSFGEVMNFGHAYSTAVFHRLASELPSEPPAGSADSMTDINDRSRQLLKLFLEQAENHAVICIDPAATVVGWLGAAQEVFGYSPDEAVGQPAAIIFTPEDLESGFDRYELALARHESRSEDDRWHVRKDGTRIWVTGSVDAIKDNSGQLLGYVKVVRDRTDLRIRIEALENEVHALKASKQRTDLFLNTLGHELRNPLSPIRTAVPAAQHRSPGRERGGGHRRAGRRRHTPG